MIRVADLRKSYGSKLALGPVDFEVQRGETLGILGRNGAGKTTLLRILAGDLRPSAGSVWIDGVDAIRSPHEARTRVGYLPEAPPVYEDMRVRDFLDFAGRLRGMSDQQIQERRPEVERLAKIDNVAGELVRHLSYGYRQRVGVAQAIIHNPPMLVLDEPTHDLDPVQIVEMRKLIQSLKGKHTVVISSHILPEIHETCDRLLVIASGHIVAAGSEAELSGRMAGARRIRVSVRPGGAPSSDPTDAEMKVRACLHSVPGVTEVHPTPREDGTTSFRVTATSDVRAAVCRALVLAGHDVLGLEPAERELENVFLELVREGHVARN
jgi:ABC-2 type transport system ATP-binding protein